MKKLTMATCIACSTLFGGTMFCQVAEPTNYPLTCSGESFKFSMPEPMFKWVLEGLDEYEWSIFVELMCDQHDFTSWFVIDRWNNECEIGWNTLHERLYN